MKFSNLLYAFIIFSAISFTACSDDASNDLVDTATVENALDTNPNINVTETIAEDGSITYTAQQDGVNLSEFTLKTDDDGMTYISYNSQGNEVPTLTEYDANHNPINETAIAIETADRFWPIVAGVILCCVNAEVGYSEADGWSGSVGFDCDCFSFGGKKATKLSPDTKYFSIK